MCLIIKLSQQKKTHLQLESMIPQMKKKKRYSYFWDFFVVENLISTFSRMFQLSSIELVLMGF